MDREIELFWRDRTIHPVLNHPGRIRYGALVPSQRQTRNQDIVYVFDIYLQGEQETAFLDL
jgi:hypothetical protein